MKKVLIRGKLVNLDDVLILMEIEITKRMHRDFDYEYNNDNQKFVDDYCRYFSKKYGIDFLLGFI